MSWGRYNWCLQCLTGNTTASDAWWCHVKVNTSSSDCLPLPSIPPYLHWDRKLRRCQALWPALHDDISTGQSAQIARYLCVWQSTSEVKRRATFRTNCSPDREAAKLQTGERWELHSYFSSVASNASLQVSQDICYNSLVWHTVRIKQFIMPGILNIVKIKLSFLVDGFRSLKREKHFP